MNRAWKSNPRPLDLGSSALTLQPHQTKYASPSIPAVTNNNTVWQRAIQNAKREPVFAYLNLLSGKSNPEKNGKTENFPE